MRILRYLHDRITLGGVVMKILLVEDDKVLKETLKFNLESEGHKVCACSNYIEAINMLNASFDLALLDINLPDGNGLNLGIEISRRSPLTYIIFLTANDLEEDMIRGYESGGTDYITKPFSIQVLLYKIRAIEKNNSRECQSNIYDDGHLYIDFNSFNSTLEGEVLEITPKEYELLEILIASGNTILTKRLLMEKIWDTDGNYVDDHTLVSIMSRLRKKIEIGDVKYIKTIYGIGYQWLGERYE